MAKTWTQMVQEFRDKYDIPTPTKDKKLINTQMDCVEEEINELNNALYSSRNQPTTDVLDAICDSIYVLVGLALAMGMDIDGAMEEVHKSNMSKLDEDGKPIYRDDGKVLKGPNFKPPKLEKFIPWRM